MDMDKTTFEKIKNRYPCILLTDDDVEQAFAFVLDILEAEATAIKETEPTAKNSISRLEAAAYEIFSIMQEVTNYNFKEVEK